MEIVKLIATAIFSVAALFIITKIMGHKQVGQLDFFDYINGITIGSIAAEMATELESPHRPLIALMVYGSTSILLNFLTSKFSRTRKYINGTPTILYNNGKIFRQNLKKAKLDLSEFMLMCRELGYFNLDEIQTAIFEHNGKMSILPKSANRPLTPQDLNLSAKEAEFGIEVIMDGRILDENLSQMGRNTAWLTKQIRARGFRDAREIFLGIYRKNDDKLDLYPNK